MHLDTFQSQEHKSTPQEPIVATTVVASFRGGLPHVHWLFDLQPPSHLLARVASRVRNMGLRNMWLLVDQREVDHTLLRIPHGVKFPRDFFQMGIGGRLLETDTVTAVVVWIDTLCASCHDESLPHGGRPSVHTRRCQHLQGDYVRRHGLGFDFLCVFVGFLASFLVSAFCVPSSSPHGFLVSSELFLLLWSHASCIFHVVKFEVAKICWAMNGFGNALVYSCNSKYVQRECIDAKNANGDDEVEAWSGLVSFYVGFEEQVDVVELTPRNSCIVDR